MMARAESPARYPLDTECELPPRLIELFLRTAPQQLAVLLDACARRDVAAVRAQAHKIKGSLYAAGASSLAESLEGLRGLVGKGDWLVVEAQLPNIRAHFEAVCRELEAHLQRGKP